MAYKGEKHGLPIVLHIAGRPVIVVGNGSEADAKRGLLTQAGARIVEEGSKALLAIVIDDAAAVSRLKVRGVLVHAVGRPDLSDFALAGADDQPVPTPRKATRSGMWGRLRGGSAGPEPVVAADEAALPDVVPEKAVPEVARQPARGAADGEDPAAETAQTAGIGVMPEDEPLVGQERPSRAFGEPAAAVVGSDLSDVAVRAAQAVPTGEIPRMTLRQTNAKAASVATPDRVAPSEIVKELVRSAGKDEPFTAAPQRAMTDFRSAEAEVVPHRPISESPAPPPAETVTSPAANTEAAETKTLKPTGRTHRGAGFSFATMEPARTRMVPLEVHKSPNAAMPPVEPVEAVTNIGGASASFVLPEDRTSPSGTDPQVQPVPEPVEVVSNMAVPPAGFVLHVREARGAIPEKEPLTETVEAVTDPVVAPSGFVLPDSQKRPVPAAVEQMLAATQAETAPAKPGQRRTRIVPNEMPGATGAGPDTTAASFSELQESREPLRSLIAPFAASFGAAAAILRARVSGPKGGHVSLDMALRKGGPLDPTVTDAWPDGEEPATRPPE